MGSSGGLFAWREVQKPRQILEALASRYKWSDLDFYHANASGISTSQDPALLHLRVAGRIFRLADFESDYLRTHPPAHFGPPDQRLALYAMLHESFPLRLTPEHVETRPLYSPLQEGIEQVFFLHFLPTFPSSSFPFSLLFPSHFLSPCYPQIHSTHIPFSSISSPFSSCNFLPSIAT